MNEGKLAATTIEAVRRLVRLKVLAYRQLDSDHLEVRQGERKAIVILQTGHWSGEHGSGQGIFSLARYLNLDMGEVNMAWTKAAGGGR